MAAGAGDVVADYEYPEPEPAPVTTIAWRMAHMPIGVFGERAANHFGDGGVDYPTTEWSLTAAGGLDLLDRHYDAWIDRRPRARRGRAGRPVRAGRGPIRRLPVRRPRAHISREAIHHAAEISLLLDLYGAR